MPGQYLRSSLGKKQITAATGLVLIGFVIMHLAGNLLLYLGPQAFNGYAHKLAGLRPGLYLIETFLLVVFLIHLHLTALIVLENRRARPVGYKVSPAEDDDLFLSRLMPWTGTVIVAFVLWHLRDFTFTDHEGARSLLRDGQSYGLYGVVYNSFTDPLHSAAYILAMAALGIHLSHGIQSFAQTFGWNHPKYTPAVKRLSHGLGFLIAAGYSSIPIYVLIKSW